MKNQSLGRHVFIRALPQIISFLAVMTSLKVFANEDIPETKRRSVRQLKKDAVPSLHDLPKIQGVGFSFGSESVFRNNAQLMKRSYTSQSGLNGAQFLSALKSASKDWGCIPNLFIGAHGFTNKNKGKMILAKDIPTKRKGLGFHESGSKASLQVMETMIERKEIKFCRECEIAIHACTVDPSFSIKLAELTQCSVVSATYKVSPAKAITGEYDHVWTTSGKGKFFRYIPVTGDVLIETIGKEYVFGVDQNMRLAKPYSLANRY